ncbi:hypothetical protein [Sigmofec virus UA08Rod_5824]|uniref:Uncharacterized protein n=1 Tax=Sigmofec virus UA08Rod_5824 TaxID=2929441 RepID=A0A976N1Y2_9VIRU|nr:hypothetical protein [Sigmofec virus UA08Rod_5824]
MVSLWYIIIVRISSYSHEILLEVSVMYCVDLYDSKPACLDYYTDGEMYMIVGTTYSFVDRYDMLDWAADCGYDLCEVSAPDVIDYDALVW